MKRHDVSTPGPDTRYPAHERQVIVFDDVGNWQKGWFDEPSGEFFGPSPFTGRTLHLDDVVAWSDPTEPDHVASTGNMVPVAWRVRWTDGSVSFRDVEPSDAAKRECQVVPLYATPPAPGESPATTVDHSALLRMAGEALQKARTYKDALIAGEWEEIDDIIAAIRAATGGV